MQGTHRKRPGAAGVLLLGLWLLLVCGGCAPLANPQAQLDKDVRQFSQRLRWGDWNAVAGYLAPEARTAFLEGWEDDRDLNLVGVEIVRIEPLSEEQARIRLEFEYFRLPSTVVRRHTLTTTWQYFPGDAKMLGRWEVPEALPPLP